MRVTFFGGFAVETDDGPVVVRGRGQEALLFRLAIDAGSTVSYRALAEDVWGQDLPEDPRASLQSLASRVRRELPDGVLLAAPGGYRLAVPRDAVDLTHFQDLVENARRADPVTSAALAQRALDLWIGDPWIPSDAFAWVRQDLDDDRALALRLRDHGAATSAALDGTLPAPLTSIVGRAQELELIAHQLSTERMVTVLGPGGAGKTTLAVEAARAWPGALLVELAPVARGDVWNALDGALGRRMRVSDVNTAPTTARERSLVALSGREVLVVLDNCEHLAGEPADVAIEILRALPGVRVLATSREPLGVPGEAFVEVGPLPTDDARELFARRIRAARGSEPVADEAAAAARIVARLDGLPLAIELAASKARTLTIAEIEEGLDDRFALLQSTARGIDRRHQTLRALIDWSWETLSPGEREATLAASVFADGIGVDDLEEVTQSFEITRADIDALLDRSLLHRVDGRYRMLETVREYGMRVLREAGREDAARRRHAEVMAQRALTYDALTRGPRVREAVAWFDANEDNLVAAARWCAATGALDVGVLLTRGQLWVWLLRERVPELGAALANFGGGATDLASEPQVIVGAAALILQVFEALRVDTDASDLRDLLPTAERIAAAAAQHPSDMSVVAAALLPGLVRTVKQSTGWTPWSRGLIAIDPASLTGAPEWSVAILDGLRAAAAENEGDLVTLGNATARALPAVHRTGDPWAIAMMSQLRSEWLMLRGDLDEALAVLDDATAGMEGLASAWDLIQQRSQAITILTRLGRIPEARARVEELARISDADGGDRTRFQIAHIRSWVEIADANGEAALEALDQAPAEPPRPFPEQLTVLAHVRRAQALLLLERVAEAREALFLAMPSAERIGDRPVLAQVIAAVAQWYAASGDPERAAWALAASDSLRGATDDTDPVLVRLRADLRRHGAPAITVDPDAPALRELRTLLE